MTARNLHDLLKASAALHPRAPAIERGPDSLDYRSFLARVDGLAERLRARGIGPGDRVAVLAARDWAEPALLFAISACRATFTCLNRLWKPAQVVQALETLAPALLVCDGATAERVVADPAFRPQPCGVLSLGALLDTRPAVLDVGDPRPDDAAAILFTSGSTGLPKGVLHSNRSLLAWTESTSAYLGTRPGDCSLALLPLAFGYGLNQLLVLVACGGSYRISRSTLVPDIVRELTEAPVTHLAGIPSFWRDFARIAPGMGIEAQSLALRLVTNAGGHCPPDTMRTVRRLIGGREVVLMYGMTETLRSTWLPSDLFDAKAGAIGIPVPGATLALVDEEGAPCRAGEVGEIIHAGPTVAEGYVGGGMDERRFRPAPDWMDVPEGTRACFTGDLARADDDGVLWYHARRDRQIKVKGFRISPFEIEEAARAMDGVDDAVALFLAGRDDEEGAIHLAVSGAPGEAELCQFLRKRVASYMMPSRIHLWPGAFPLTPNGKTDVEAIRARLVTP